MPGRSADDGQHRTCPFRRAFQRFLARRRRCAYADMVAGAYAAIDVWPMMPSLATRFYNIENLGHLSRAIAFDHAVKICGCARRRQMRLLAH